MTLILGFVSRNGRSALTCADTRISISGRNRELAEELSGGFQISLSTPQMVCNDKGEISFPYADGTVAYSDAWRKTVRGPWGFGVGAGCLPLVDRCFRVLSRTNRLSADDLMTVYQQETPKLLEWELGEDEGFRKTNFLFIKKRMSGLMMMCRFDFASCRLRAATGVSYSPPRRGWRPEMGSSVEELLAQNFRPMQNNSEIWANIRLLASCFRLVAGQCDGVSERIEVVARTCDERRNSVEYHLVGPCSALIDATETDILQLCD